METYTKLQVKELMLKAFKMGQEKFEADPNDFPIRLWIAGEIDAITSQPGFCDMDYDTSNAEGASCEVETNGN